MNTGYAIPEFWVQAGPPEWALSEVRSRRVFALALDLIAISALFLFLFILVSLLGFVTFGLTWAAIPILYPAIGLLYNGLTISGWKMATPGMRIAGLEMRLVNGTQPPFLNAALHVLLLYLSVTFLTPLILLVSFVAKDKRCLHDLFAGVVVTRRL